MKKETDKLNIAAMVKAGEVEKYSKEYFKLHGSKGGKKGGGKWFKSLTDEKRKEHLEKMAKGRVIHN